MKKTMVILALFLLLLLPFSAMAGTGSIKVIDKNGIDVTKDNLQEGAKEAEEGGEKELIATNETIPNPTRSTKDMETSIKAAQTAYEGALNGFANGLIDSLYEGSVNIYDTDVTKTEEGTVTYNIKVRELKPYEHPLVLPMQLVSFGFLVLVTFITILGSMLLSAFQSHEPEKYGDWKRSVSGEYKPYNPSRVHTACVWAITRPVKAFVLFILIVYGRNFILLSMPQTASGVLDAATDNIIIRAITGASIFVGSLQTAIGEYGVYTFGALLFVVYILTDFMVLGNAPGVAKKIEQVFWGAFGIFCLCDLINMFCTSFGVSTSQWREESIFITVGIMSGAFINFVLLAVLTVVAALKGKKVLGV